MPLRAICFDLDGLLADTEPHYFEAHRAAFAVHGVHLTMEEYARAWIIEGTKTADEAPRRGITADPAAISADAFARFNALMEQELKPMPFALETVKSAAALVPTALVTNTHHAAAAKIVERLGLAPYLRHLVTRERYARAKPMPDAYLAAAETLGVAPADALALEDSPRGMKAALAAGLKCVLVLNAMTRFGGRPEGPIRICDSLAEVDFGRLAREFDGR